MVNAPIMTPNCFAAFISRANDGLLFFTLFLTIFSLNRLAFFVKLVSLALKSLSFSKLLPPSLLSKGNLFFRLMSGTPRPCPPLPPRPLCLVLKTTSCYLLASPCFSCSYTWQNTRAFYPA